jgi:uncharacterized protein involved in exopolysaccharide biosynthesis
MNAQITFRDIQGFIRRRKRICITIFSVIFGLALILALVLPPLFESQATILVMEQEIPEQYVQSGLSSYAAERIELITRQIMSFSNLKSVVEKFNLYHNLVADGQIGKAVGNLKDSIEIEMVNTSFYDKSGRPNTATTAFTLAYLGEEPATVQKVTQALASLYVEEDTKAKAKQVAVTADFIENELNVLKEQIKTYEKKISDFKSTHIGQLPENTAANIQAQERVQRDIDNIDSQLRNLEDRKIYLKGQLATIEPLNPIMSEQGKLTQNPKERLKTLRLELIRLQSILSDKHPDIKKLKSEIAELEAQVGESDDSVAKVKLLSEKQSKLTELKSKLGPRHPDVVTLENEVSALSKEVDKLLTTKSSLEVAQEHPDNPAYINIMTQIVSADTEIRSLLDRQLKLKSDMEQYQGKIESAPSVEKEYNELTMDYANAKKKYDDMLNKSMEARVAMQLQESQYGERFLIAEPAFLPQKPSKPNRLAILLLGFVLAFGAGASIAAILEGLDHSVKTDDELGRIMGVPVLSTISLVETDDEKQTKRLKRLLWFAGTAGAIAVTLIIINSLIVPLDELWESLRLRMKI